MRPSEVMLGGLSTKADDSGRSVVAIMVERRTVSETMAVATLFIYYSQPPTTQTHMITQPTLSLPSTDARAPPASSLPLAAASIADRHRRLAALSPPVTVAAAAVPSARATYQRSSGGASQTCAAKNSVSRPVCRGTGIGCGARTAPGFGTPTIARRRRM